MKGADVIFQDAHVSGHACQEEIKLIYTLVKPKYAIPVHGEYRHLKAQAGIARELGIPKENIIMMAAGKVLSINKNGARITDEVQTGAVFVDGLGVGDVGNVVIRDRQQLAEDGILMAVMTLERGTNMVVSGPDIVTRGFIYVKESDEVMDEMREVLNNAMDKIHEKNIMDWGKMRNIIKDALSGYVWKKMKRRPMIMPIIMETDQE